jgi:dTDP-4-dehydrorhamnose 3,5-epimerase
MSEQRASLASTLEAPRRDIAREEEPDAVAARRVAGVRVRRIHGYHDHRGALQPFLEMTDPFWDEPVVHGYLFTIRPGRIKGWGMHRRQADRYCVLNGDVRVALYDGREGSATYRHVCELFFTDATPGLVYIPQGVWHAAQNYGDSLARIFNLPTTRFDPADPDKYRIDPHSGEIPFDWRLPDG